MGVFGKSMSREIGKNTGKWVSNKVFGDGHSTPYRVKVTRARSEEKKKLLNLELKSKRTEHDRQIELLGKEQELLDAQRIHELEGNTSKQISELAKTKIPTNPEAIIDFMDELILKLDSSSWHSIFGSDNEKEGKINNKLMNAFFSKYKQALLKLKKQNVEEESIYYYEEKLKKLLWKKRFGLYKGFALLAFVALAYLIFYLLTLK